MAPAASETRLSPLSLRVLSILDHGEWVDQEEVIEEAQYFVSPGEAFRHAQEKSRTKGIRPQREMDDMIASGRRKRTVGIINSLIQNGRVERKGGTGRYDQKFLRLVKRVTNIYVVRDRDGSLSVHQLRDPDVVVHVIDAWKKSDDPGADAQTLIGIMKSIPDRFPGREEIEEVLRRHINRLQVDATVARTMSTFEGTSLPSTPSSSPLTTPSPDQTIYEPTTTLEGDEA